MSFNQLAGLRASTVGKVSVSKLAEFLASNSSDIRIVQVDGEAIEGDSKMPFDQLAAVRELMIGNKSIERRPGHVAGLDVLAVHAAATGIAAFRWRAAALCIFSSGSEEVTKHGLSSGQRFAQTQGDIPSTRHVAARAYSTRLIRDPRD